MDGLTIASREIINFKTCNNVVKAMATHPCGPILEMETVEMRFILSIISMPTLVNPESGRFVGQGDAFGLSLGRNSIRLIFLIRIASIFYLSLTPILISSTGGSRDVIPQCVTQAGRNEGFYRRLKWLEAQQVAIECSGSSKGL